MLISFSVFSISGDEEEETEELVADEVDVEDTAGAEVDETGAGEVGEEGRLEVIAAAEFSLDFSDSGSLGSVEASDTTFSLVEEVVDKKNAIFSGLWMKRE